MKRLHLILALLLAITGSLLVTCCASIGNPDGGRYDEEPPRVVAFSPDNKALGNTKKKISILFDEYIKMENANDKVVVSPPQIEAPNIRADGKRVRVDLYDTLRPNTTYTIDFSDAIVDNNESNPLGQFTYSFSTGETIDTMEVAGTVLNAENLEPIKGILVGLYPADSTYSDTLFTTTPFLRVSRTDGSGKFSIKGVKDGTYHAFALQDMDGNYMFSQKSEVIAFDTTTISTSSRPDLRPDTVWGRDSVIEKIRMVPFIHYYPDNFVLKAFLEAGQDLHLLKTEYPVPDHFTLYFTAPMDTLPTIQGINFDAATQLIAEPTEHNDTITYWVTDTTVAYQDSLSFYLTYMDTDTTGTLVSRTDTMLLNPKTTHAKLEKERLKSSEDWQKDREKKIKRSKEPLPYEENPYEVVYMDLQIKPTGTLDPNQNPVFTFSEPIEYVDTTKIHFSEKIDSDYVERPFLFLPVEGKMRQYMLYAEWEPQKQYLLEVDSMAFRGALGHWGRPIKQDLRIRPVDEFGTLFVHLSQKEDGCIVQLLNKSDKPVAEARAEGGRADFFYLKPGDYYLRMYIDSNGNDRWDTGDYAQGLQPEEVFYFPRPIPIKAKFEIEQDWNYRSIEANKQKPLDITKQKPDKKRSVRNRNAEREEEMRKGKTQGNSNNNQRGGNSMMGGRMGF